MMAFLATRLQDRRDVSGKRHWRGGRFRTGFAGRFRGDPGTGQHEQSTQPQRAYGNNPEFGIQSWPSVYPRPRHGVKGGGEFPK